MEKTKQESKIKDIFSGEYIQAWEDEENTFISFFQNGISIAIPNEDYKSVIKELKKLK